MSFPVLSFTMPKSLRSPVYASRRALKAYPKSYRTTIITRLDVVLYCSRADLLLLMLFDNIPGQVGHHHPRILPSTVRILDLLGCVLELIPYVNKLLAGRVASADI